MLAPRLAPELPPPAAADASARHPPELQLAMAPIILLVPEAVPLIGMFMIGCVL